MKKMQGREDLLEKCLRQLLVQQEQMRLAVLAATRDAGLELDLAAFIPTPQAMRLGDPPRPGQEKESEPSGPVVVRCFHCGAAIEGDPATSWMPNGTTRWVMEHDCGHETPQERAARLAARKAERLEQQAQTGEEPGLAHQELPTHHSRTGKHADKPLSPQQAWAHANRWIHALLPELAEQCGWDKEQRQRAQKLVHARVRQVAKVGQDRPWTQVPGRTMERWAGHFNALVKENDPAAVAKTFGHWEGLLEQDGVELDKGSW